MIKFEKHSKLQCNIIFYSSQHKFFKIPDDFPSPQGQKLKFILNIILSYLLISTTNLTYEKINCFLWTYSTLSSLFLDFGTSAYGYSCFFYLLCRKDYWFCLGVTIRLFSICFIRLSLPWRIRNLLLIFGKIFIFIFGKNLKFFFVFRGSIPFEHLEILARFSSLIVRSWYIFEFSSRICPDSFALILFYFKYSPIT